MLLLVLVIAISSSSAAMGDPPITPPIDPSVIPVMPAEFTSPQPAVQALHSGALRQVNGKIQLYVKAAHRWETLMGLPLTRSSYRAGSTQSVAYATWVLKLWKTRAKHRHIQAKHWMVQRTEAYLADAVRLRGMLGLSSSKRQLLGDGGNIESRLNKARRLDAQLAHQWAESGLVLSFGCIHHYEGAWNANTGNGYYGGLQMDLDFQKTYGGEFLARWGTADNWPIWAQIQAAVRAYRSGRGFNPWPNTARACGLL
jgi:hypothetical protein